MKTSQGIIAILAVLGLAGCGQSGMPTHPMSYYLKHPKAAAKVVAYCQKRWPENRPYKSLSTEQDVGWSNPLAITNKNRCLDETLGALFLP
ncbi:lipoprotein [Acidithiobacillus ferriphilus]|uniref:hypothetical protein n=1 Tax=Acidithiobacillus ferriphilus TaxID=1689834 RepID=UPI003F50F124